MSAFLRHFLDRATVPHLTTEVLHGALVDHSAGNPRILTSMAAELLDMAARRNLPQLDEKLSFEVHSRSPQPPRTRRQA